MKTTADTLYAYVCLAIAAQRKPNHDLLRAKN